MEKSERRADYVALFEIYNVFKLWFAECYPGKKPIDREEFAIEMTRILGEAEDQEKRYFGYKMKSEIKKFTH